MAGRGKFGKLVSWTLAVAFLALIVVLVLGKVPVGVSYGSVVDIVPDAATNGLDIVEAARSQIGVTIAYDPSYQP